MNDIGPNVPEHLDKNLGIQDDQSIWSYKEMGFWILKYDDQPQKQACSYITAGLGRHLLEQESGQKIRQELLFTIWEEYTVNKPEDKLASLSLDFLDRHIPIPNHQVIPWEDGVFENYDFSAVYCTGARQMPEEFEMIEAEPNLIFVWLIPIYPTEQKFCKEYGWSKFEDLINEQQPDFFNLERDVIKLKINNVLQGTRKKRAPLKTAFDGRI
jgi:hypothetical protein